jgi:hypothetical protein
MSAAAANSKLFFIITYFKELIKNKTDFQLRKLSICHLESAAMAGDTLMMAT